MKTDTSLRSATLASALALSLPLAARAAEYKQVDPAASRIAFSYTQMGVNMDGRFAKFTTKLAFDPAKPTAARAVLEIPLASIDAGSNEANDEVKGKAWFDTAAHPTARFESTAVKALGNNRFELTGKLSIKGRTQQVVAPLSYTAQGNKGVFDGSFVIHRKDFAIGEGQWADTGVVANDVKVQFRIQALAD